MPSIARAAPPPKEISNNLLSGEERKTYERLFWGRPATVAHWRGLLTLAAYFAVVLGIFQAAMLADRNEGSNWEGPLLLLTGVAAVCGILPVGAAFGKDREVWSKRVAGRYLEEIGFHGRVPRDDVRYVDGKVFRIVRTEFPATRYYDRRRRRWLVTEEEVVVKRLEVGAAEVPPTDQMWPDERWQRFFDERARRYQSLGSRSTREPGDATTAPSFFDQFDERVAIEFRDNDNQGG